MTYLPEQTIPYKTYLKTAMVEAMQGVYQNHKDALLSKTKVTIEFPRTQASYPAIIVRFFEREIKNAGVGHSELLKDEDGNFFKAKHSFYSGDIEFAIYGLSSLDRDLISDTVVQTILMGELEAYTNRFFARIYPTDDTYQFSDIHYVNVNADKIAGFGESQMPVPWGAEDDLLYQTSYRVPISGEFYSLPPDAPVGFIQKVDQYPYIEGLDAIPTGDVGDGAPWESFG